jgi:hypothetical protein
MERFDEQLCLPVTFPNRRGEDEDGGQAQESRRLRAWIVAVVVLIAPLATILF